MDPSRLTVDRAVLHHAVTPLWDNRSKAQLAQWFSDVGFTNGYGGNPANWNGNINPFTGGRSYAMAQAVGQRVTSATPDATAAERAAGYRVFPIIRNHEQRIAYHAGNWNINQRSVGIENLGDYRNYALRDGDLKVIADFLRPIDKKVGGRMHILLHNEVIGTICPARIREGRAKIIDYINNPPKPPAPKPAPTPPAKASLTWKKLPKVTTYTVNKSTNLWSFNSATWGNVKPVKAFKKGDRVDIYGEVVNKTLNATYLLTEYSYKNKTTNGFNVVDMTEVKTPAPKPEPTPAPTPKPTPAPTPAPELPPEPTESPQEPSEPETGTEHQDATKGILENVIRALKPLWELLVKLWNAKY